MAKSTLLTLPKLKLVSEKFPTASERNGTIGAENELSRGYVGGS